MKKYKYVFVNCLCVACSVHRALPVCECVFSYMCVCVTCACGKWFKQKQQQKQNNFGWIVCVTCKSCFPFPLSIVFRVLCFVNSPAVRTPFSTHTHIRELLIPTHSIHSSGTDTDTSSLILTNVRTFQLSECDYVCVRVFVCVLIQQIV